MKKLVLSLMLGLCLFTAPHARADIEGAPFIPEIDKRFNAIEQGNHYKTGSYPAGAADGHYAQQSVQASYNFSTVGGTAGTYDLGVSLPKNAIITRSYLYSIKQPYGTSSPKIAFFCQTANNIYNPSNTLSVSADGTFAEGSQTGTAANMSVITAKCDISAVTTGTIQSGLVTVYVDYVVHQ